jgi:HEAT repeat protein
MNDDLLNRLGSSDPNVSGLALSELTARGPEALPTLLEALDSERVEARRAAMEGLGDLADSSAANRVKAALEDPDGQVRSLAAVALARMEDPAALDALADTLNDWPDLLHSEMSRSTYELPRLGLSALRVAIPLLASDSWEDRSKGAWVAHAVLEQVAGPDEAGPDRSGPDRSGPEESQLNRLRDILEDFQSDGDPEHREAAAAKAQDWLRASGLGAES